MAGMTAMPEAGLARELGLDYAGLAVVSNHAAGITGDLLSEDDIAETLREPMQRVRSVIQSLVRLLAASSPSSF
jgi:purine nucleoside phosphorylase